MDELRLHGLLGGSKKVTRFDKPPYFTNPVVTNLGNKNVTYTGAAVDTDAIVGDFNDNFIIYRPLGSHFAVIDSSGAYLHFINEPVDFSHVFGMALKDKTLFINAKINGGNYVVYKYEIPEGYTGGTWGLIHSTADNMQMYEIQFDRNDNLITAQVYNPTLTMIIKTWNAMSGALLRTIEISHPSAPRSYTFKYSSVHNAFSFSRTSGNFEYVYDYETGNSINEYSITNVSDESKSFRLDMRGVLHTIALNSSSYRCYTRRDFISGAKILQYIAYQTGAGSMYVEKVTCTADGYGFAIMYDSSNSRVVRLTITKEGVGAWNALSFSAGRSCAGLSLSKHGRIGYIVAAEGYSTDGYLTGTSKLSKAGQFTVVTQNGQSIEVKETAWWSGAWTEVKSGDRYTFTVNTLLNFLDDFIILE